MDNNEISMIMDIKLDVHDKIRFKQWTRCQVKIEAVKCLPCFLRVSFTPQALLGTPEAIEAPCTSISINVPGVTISLASSRTRDFSYGMFWTQSRRTCFIYFALETELRCRRLMKWIKKSIKNLELHRQIVLEQRRNSRGPIPLQKHLLLPHNNGFDELDSGCSYTSGIYEEICEEEPANGQNYQRNKSRVSIASGIYEEMKPMPANGKLREIKHEVAPPLPPLPPHRKRINTFETEVVGELGNIPRSNTNPESEAIKKKKYKNVFDNIFGGSRSKRAESVSETQACSIEDLINCPTPQKTPGHKETMRRRKKEERLTAKEKRNSFSSPDLSKINFLHYDEDDNKCTDVKNSFSLSRDLTEFATPAKPKTKHINVPEIRRDSLDSLNISAQIPNNFNFSAINNSNINLMGANGAAVAQVNTTYKNSKIQIDDLSGYCVMAPINIKPETETSDTNLPKIIETKIEVHVENTSKTEESAIYINMNNSSQSTATGSPLLTGQQFTNNLYENLLTVKATQELETLSVMTCAKLMTTSTPTECMHDNSPKPNTKTDTEDENFYQTPRKSIISIDDKVPSYYPNIVSDYGKQRRMSRSPLKERRLSAEIKAHEKQELKDKGKDLKPCKLPAKRNKSHKIKTTAVQKISENVYAVARMAKNNAENGKKENLIEDSCVAGGGENDGLPNELKHLAVLPKIDFKFDDVKSLMVKEPSTDHEAVLRNGKSVVLARQMRAASHTPQKYTYEVKQKSQTPPMNTGGAVKDGYAGQLLQLSGGMKKFASLPRLKKFDFSPLRLRINNVLQRQQLKLQPLTTTPPVAETNK